MYVNILLISIYAGSLYQPEGSWTDYNNYRVYFLNSLEFKPSKELIFYFLNTFIREFTENFTIAFFVIVLIINYFVVVTIYRYSKNVELSLILYLILGGLLLTNNILQQMLALSICFYSIYYLVENKNIKFIILNIIAANIHITALVFLIICICVKKYNNLFTKKIYSYIFISYLLVCIEPVITQFVYNWLYKGESLAFNYGSSILHYLLQLIILLFYLLFYKKIKDSKLKFFVNISIWSSVFIFIGLKSVLYYRIGLYFNIFNILIIPNLIKELSKYRIINILKYMIVIVITAYYVLYIIPYVDAIPSYILDMLR